MSKRTDKLGARPNAEEQAQRARLDVFRSRGLRVFLVFSIVWVTTAGLAVADDAEVTHYRRIFVPADDLSAWPRGDEKLLPIEARDFEAWVAAADRDAEHGRRAVTIAEASYSARFDGQQWAAGRGWWQVELHGAGPAILDLDSRSPTIGDPRWAGEEAAPARLGTWGGDGGPPARLGLEVTRPGRLEFHWHAPWQETPEGCEVSLRLPPATVTRLSLELPEGMRPVLEGSVVLESRRLGDSQRRWTLAVAQPVDTKLRVVSADAERPAAPPDASVSEELRYEISEHGLEIFATLSLDGLAADAGPLVVPLPTGVQLLGASWEDEELSWELIAGDAASAPRAVIELPEAVAQPSRRILLRAWQALEVDRRWAMPVLRPEGYFWTTGTIELSIAATMELRVLSPSECLRTGVRFPLEGEDGSETWSLQPYSPAAKVEVSVGPRRPEATARIGTNLEAGDPEVTGRSTTQLEVSRGSLHALSAEVRHDWIIESVQTIPADALDAWYLDQEEGTRRLEIQLARAVRDGGQLTVVVTGRLKRSGPLEPLATRSLGLLHWQEMKTVRNVVAVRTMEPYVVESAVGLPVVAATGLTPADRALIEVPASGHVYDISKAARDAAIQLGVKRGNYLAQIQVDVTCTGDELLQTYQIVCQPQGSHIDSLLVYVSQPLDSNVEWTTPSSGGRLVAERVAADSPLWARLAAGGELWQLRLRRPSAEPVEIVAAVAQRWSGRTAVPLVSVPEANVQQAGVRVRSDGEHQPLVEPLGLEPVPLPSDRYGANRPDRPRLLAAYRYDPSRWQDDVRQPRLLLTPASDEREPSGIVARWASLTSFYAADGVGSHRVTYQLENSGRAKLELKLPTGAQLVDAEVDGRRRTLTNDQATSPTLSIDLPRRARTAEVSLFLETSQGPLAAGSRLAPPLPEGPFALLAGEWNVALPEEFEMAESAHRAGGGFNWRRRLFGPLGGEATSGRLEPSSRGALEPSRSAASQSRLHDSATGLLASATAPLPRPDGWGNYRLTFVGQEPAGIVVTHPPSIRTWAISLFLVSLVGGYRLRRGRRTLPIVALALAASLALLLPATYAPLATGALAGLLASLVVAWPRGVPPREVPTKMLQRMTTVGSTAVVVTLAAVGNLVWASPDEDASAPNDQRLERVFIPVDEEGRVVSDRYYVSERLLKKLLRQSAGPEAEGRDWLVRAAVVRGQLTHSMDQSELVCGQWALTLEIQSLARDTRIELPLVRDEAEWAPRATLDGIPTPIRWNAEGTGAVVEISEPGEYELVLSFTPVARRGESQHEVLLTLPKLLRAELQLSYPAETTGLEVRGVEALGQQSTGTFAAALDGSGSVELCWPRGAVPVAGGASPRVTELRWLKIDAEGALLEVKYALEGAGRHPESLLVAADQGWQLLTSPDGWPEAELEESDDGRQRLRVPLIDESTRDGVPHREGRLRLRLERRHPWGQIRLPLLERIAGADAGFDIGLSMDDGVDCRVLGSEKFSTGESGEFLAAWGPLPASEAPQIVLTNLRSSDRLEVGVQPRTPLSRIDEVLHLAATDEWLRVQYQADVEPGESRRYQYSLEVPAGLVVEEVLLSRGGAPVPLRWVRVSPEQVNVFFSQEVEDPYRLVLIGAMRRSGAQRYALPRVTAISDQSAAQLVQLYREESVLVEVDGPVTATSRAAEGRSRQEGPASPPLQWNARLVGSYRLDAKMAELAHVVIAPNRAELNGETLFTLLREAGEWWGIFTCRLQVERGEADNLRLRVPASWSGPFEVRSSSHSVSATVTPIDDRQASLALHIAPTVRSGEELSLEIRAPLAAGAAQPIAVPEIVLDKRGNRRRYVAVPARLDGEVLSWTHVGANPAELPEGLRPAGAHPQIVQSYRAMTTPFRVALESPRPAERSATVRMADTLVLPNADGGGISVTRFVIAPNGLVECAMELPAEETLVSVRLDGHPALVQRDASRPGAWRVQLGAPQLPQNLEVVSRHDHGQPGSARRIELRRPTLYRGEERIPVELSLWSLAGTGFSGRPEVNAAARTTALDQAALRLDRLVSIAEAATSAAVERGLAEGYDWFRPWAETLAAARSESQRLLAEYEPTSTVVQVTHPEREQLVAASERVAAWIEQGEELWAPTSDAPPAAEPAWRLDGDRQWVHYVAEEGDDRLAIQWLGAGATAGEARFVGLLMILGIAAGTLWLAHRPAVVDWLWRWPHALGVLVGIAYWAWLQPSWFGLVIAAGSVLLLLGQGWRRRLPWDETSTVLR